VVEIALQSLIELFSPLRLGFLFTGTLIGLFLGAIPGLGGIVGLAILLPFTFDLDPMTAMALLLGMLAPITTGDTITAILLGVPGTVGSQATILDGHPMARKGEAGRAFGAAFFCSMLGGLFGAFLLAVAIPVIQPIALAFGSPELFMLGLVGISVLAVVSQGALLKGLIAGVLGLLISMIGADPNPLGGVQRWTFGQLYLWDGVPIVPLTLGLFAIPEIMELLARGTTIADVPVQAMKGKWDGIKDVLQNWFLMLRCSAIGTWIGIIPGLGADVVDWLAYGHATQTSKDNVNFGQGDVRGVIAPESANNAKLGGSLIPTIAFGVPGSISMALLLGAFMIQGLVPGPDMLTQHLNIVYTIVWSVALANVIGSGICLMLANQIARVATIPIHILAPIILVASFLGAFQASNRFEDIVLFLVFGALGWFMQQHGWPRPPLVLGAVLGSTIEKYLIISYTAFGYAWLLRPWVILLFVVMVASVIYGSFGRGKSSAGHELEGKV